MCSSRASGSVVWPYLMLLVLVLVVTSVTGGDESPSFFQRLSQFAASLRLPGRDAPLDPSFDPRGRLIHVDLSDKVRRFYTFVYPGMMINLPIVVD